MYYGLVTVTYYLLGMWLGFLLTFLSPIVAILFLLVFFFTGFYVVEAITSALGIEDESDEP
jgi:hypothetical protein